jgi:hypothetical protein
VRGRGWDTEVAGLDTELLCPVAEDVESEAGCDAEVAELEKRPVCPDDVDKGTLRF